MGEASKEWTAEGGLGWVGWGGPWKGVGVDGWVDGWVGRWVGERGVGGGGGGAVWEVGGRWGGGGVCSESSTGLDHEEWEAGCGMQVSGSSMQAVAYRCLAVACRL